MEISKPFNSFALYDNLIFLRKNNNFIRINILRYCMGVCCTDGFTVQEKLIYSGISISAQSAK